MTGRFAFWLAVVAALFGACILPAAAQDNIWTVAKTSGEAWVGSATQSVSLNRQTQLRPGNSISTGRNGRVLLVRGQETILISPNSAISLPEAGRSGLSTVIQRAGTIMLDVEKRNVQHFEVETPYLAAVVKGTRFRVSIAGGQARVDVVRGQVQVTDFRSGDYTLVNPQQFARTSAGGAVGLRVGGSGQLGTILRGPSQTPRVQPLRIPAGGLKPDAGAVPLRNAKLTTSASAPGPVRPVTARTSTGGARIVAPIGELHLNIRQVTNGMARNESGGNARSKDWSDRLQPGNGGNDIRTDNNGSARPGGNGSSPGGAPSTAAMPAGSPAAGNIIISNAPTSSIGSGGGGQNDHGGGSGSGQKGNGGHGNGGSSGGNSGRSPGGLLDVVGQLGGGLDALIENRGRGNAYGLIGGNGIGKALGLGKKK